MTKWNEHCFGIQILPCLSFPCRLAKLSVAPLGLRSEILIAFLLTGNIPVFRKPDCIAATVKDFLQTGTKGIQKSCLGIAMPTFRNKYSLSCIFQLVLKFANGVESRGWRMCEVWPGMASTSILFAVINNKKGRL